MECIDTVNATRELVRDLPSRFMLDGATYARGSELGFEGLDFYFAGRGGALGDVHPDVVAAAFGFMNPATVREAWARAAAVRPATEAGAAFAECCHAWGRNHLDDTTDHARLAVLLERVVHEANPAGAPLFAGWRALPEPTDAKARVVHFANALRELRNARHIGAVLAAGLTPRNAVELRSPQMAGFFGWSTPEGSAPEHHQAMWDAAELGTDRACCDDFEALTAVERDELAALAAAAMAGAS